jgi:uncharacterized protein (TIGR02588 family)
MTRKDPAAKLPAGEWIGAGIGAVLLLGAIGYLAREGFRREPGVPDPRFRVQEIRKTGAGYLILFQARNAGTGTAQDLKVVARLDCGDAIIETGETNLQYLPPTSTVTGGIYFGRDPGRCALRFRPEGYTEP